MIRVLATAWQSRRGSCKRLWSALQTCSYAVKAASTPCVPVVIVGAGPTGLVLSSLLSQYGIQHMLLEKGSGLTQHPQAHYINNRTMEVFRGIPGLSQQVAALSPPLAEWRRFIYCESMVEGQLLGEVDHFPGQSAACDPSVSPEPVAHLSQHRLVQLLHDTAQQLAKAAGADSSIRFNREVTSVSLVSFPHQLPLHHKTQPHQHQQPLHHPLQQQSQQQQPSQKQQPQQQQQQAAVADQGGVLSGDEAAQQYPVCVALSDNSQGKPQQQLVRCSYLVAADGSHSIIRRLLGIQMQGEAGMQHLISIHFSWPQLGRALLQSGRRGMLYFVFNSQVVAVLVAHNIQEGEFVAQLPYFPPLQSAAQFTPELCSQLIQAAAGFTQQQQHNQQTGTSYPSGLTPAGAAAATGPGASGPQVHSIKQWVMSAEVAEEYGAWGNRLLLAGDAAHRFPPAGGFGMNTGIQDAHNLAWKLAAVLTDRADPTLLSTYQPERRPVAQANASLSVNNWREAIRVPQALGLDPGAASLVNKVVSSAPLPVPVASWLLDAALTAGRGLANAVIPLRRGALQDILASGMSLRLQFPREDLGFVYSNGAVDAGSEEQQRRQQQAGSSSSGQRRDNVYQPAIVVGGRLPHCWLQMLGPSGRVHKVSALDLCTADTLALNMLLICTAPNTYSKSSGSSSSSGWAAAGLQLQGQGWPLQVLQVLPAGAELPDAAIAAVTAAGTAQQADWAVDVDGAWAQLQAEHGGRAAVFVRPDGHIAWCSSVGGTGVVAEGTSGSHGILERVLSDVLCLLQPSEGSAC